MRTFSKDMKYERVSPPCDGKGEIIMGDRFNAFFPSVVTSEKGSLFKMLK